MPGIGDYNPDKEGHVKHEYVVINAEQNGAQGVTIGNKEYQFNDQGYFKIGDDPALAQDIRQTVGRSATVTRVRTPDAADRGHKYHFGQMPEMPWKRRKVTDGEETNASAQEEEKGQEVSEPIGRADGQHDQLTPQT